MQIILIIVLLGCYFLFFNQDIKDTAGICIITLLIAGACGLIFGIANASALEIALVVSLGFLLRQAYQEI
ncbi:MULTISPECIES: hypothetical protein [unclassified Enterococcus]|uniref:hypothetical protein n=1 Tax=unclassified Enterococcus TaxID=2608891 RepID=UPI0015518F0A|nr:MULTISPECIES: hypothetical protein [unclassified Enterococcus]MBS7577254.1 hypothetical protein [Enterococcus sp. MMGLQ5-2]MBS7584653.1 hypothetical protein [Enterococcus sp. MMGLQ5-1]NPD12508.1 hypothetical protein [Enterococcus sp. MMGLQ5-1]NPD37088.1 hypothetical protein [Enterococcus sp. MMGLQ5-2]